MPSDLAARNAGKVEKKQAGVHGDDPWLKESEDVSRLLKTLENMAFYKFGSYFVPSACNGRTKDRMYFVLRFTVAESGQFLALRHPPKPTK